MLCLTPYSFSAALYEALVYWLPRSEWSTAPLYFASQLPVLLSRAHCVFVNSVHVYDDKIIVLFNYKDGEKCISLDELGDKEKKSNTQNKCSTLIKSGDPSGNRTRDTLIKSQVLYRLS